MRHLIAGLVIGAVVVAAPVSVVSAQSSQSTPTTMGSNDAALKQRLEKRKSALRTKLTNAQQMRIQQRCKNAQGKLQAVSKTAVAAQQNREKVYTGVIERTATLRTKLVAANVNTAQIDAAVSATESNLTALKATSVLYQQALSDAAMMDCAADPAAFQASLLEARTALVQLKADAGKLRTSVNEQLKPALVSAKTSLSGKQGVQ